MSHVTVPRGSSRRWLGLAVASLLVLLALVLLRATAAGARLDHRAEDSIGGGTALFSSVSTLVSWLQPLTGLVALGAVGLTLLPHFRTRAIAALLVLAGANGATWVLKHALVLVLGPDAATLPSGHATLALTSATAVVMLVPTVWRWRVYPFAGLVATIGVFGAVTALWHRPGDTLASVAVVLVCLTIVRLVMQCAGSSTVPEVEDPPARRDVVSLAAGAVAFVGLLVVWHFRAETSSAESLLLAVAETLALPAGAVLVTAVATRVVPEEVDRTH